MKLTVSGSGYEEVRESRGGDSVYVHRLAAVAEHGFEAVCDKDVHHEHVFDGRPCQWFNARDALTPENPTEHRCRTLRNVASD